MRFLSKQLGVTLAIAIGGMVALTFVTPSVSPVQISTPTPAPNRPAKQPAEPSHAPPLSNLGSSPVERSRIQAESPIDSAKIDERHSEPPNTDPMSNEMKLKASRRQESRLAFIEKEFDQEGKDTRWSFEAEHGLREAYQHTEAASQLHLEIGCHSTICRVAFTLDPGLSSSVAEVAAKEMVIVPPWKAQGFMKLDSDRGVLFLGREGKPLPDIMPE
jgi:hypothetical protein